MVGMQRSSENKWPWPEELDALKAAPQHHKLLFENQVVRVLDTRIPPAETTAVHTHKWPASLYVISWSDFIRYDGEDNVLLDSRALTKPPSPSSALWTEPVTPHALKNVGSKDLHVISCEIKNTK
jgi:isopentenyldiphosphate isomerase